ncbi:hypothetical protein ACH5RR_039319 [Cinchona calisaya]|uniref:Protein kinase domain-containing protein n=1 Tax=Cinchona calisaya TaxID=153742 RepID=A0ABD2XXW7_9GENT
MLKLETSVFSRDRGIFVIFVISIVIMVSKCLGSGIVWESQWTALLLTKRSGDKTIFISEEKAKSIAGKQFWLAKSASPIGQDHQPHANINEANNGTCGRSCWENKRRTLLSLKINRCCYIDILTRGLEHLLEHCNPPVIHRNLKSSNILLDSYYNAKLMDCAFIQLSDFGLAISGGTFNKNNIKLSGTQGYVAPQYLQDDTPRLLMLVFFVVCSLKKGKRVFISATSGAVVSLLQIRSYST